MSNCNVRLTDPAGETQAGDALRVYIFLKRYGRIVDNEEHPELCLVGGKERFQCLY